MSGLQERGGIVGRTELAEHWGVSRQRVAQLTGAAGFPEPIGTAYGQPVWLLDDCDQWRSSRPGPGRPRQTGGQSS